MNENNIKKNQYDEFQNFFPFTPEAIFVFSAGLKNVQDEFGKKKWLPTDYTDQDEFGVLGGQDRFEAAAAVGKYFSTAILVSTSRPMIDGCEVTHAGVGAQSLQAFGIEPQRILLEEESVNLITQIREMLKLAVLKRWGRIVVISSGFQIERIQVMFDNFENLMGSDLESVEFFKKTKVQGVQFCFVSSDTILSVIDPNYKDQFKILLKSKAWRLRLASEKQGIQAVLEGNYRSAQAKMKLEKKG